LVQCRAALKTLQELGKQALSEGSGHSPNPGKPDRLDLLGNGRIVQSVSFTFATRRLRPRNMCGTRRIAALRTA